MSSAPGLHAGPDPGMYFRPTDRHLPFAFDNHNPGKEACHFVCGYLGCDVSRSIRCWNSLPRVFHAQMSHRRRIGWGICFTSRPRRASLAAPAARPCWPSSLNLMSLKLSANTWRLPEGSRGWLLSTEGSAHRPGNAAHSRAAVSAMDAGDSSQEVGLSRSVFTDRLLIMSGSLRYSISPVGACNWRRDISKFVATALLRWPRKSATIRSELSIGVSGNAWGCRPALGARHEFRWSKAADRWYPLWSGRVNEHPIFLARQRDILAGGILPSKRLGPAGVSCARRLRVVVAEGQAGRAIGPFPAGEEIERATAGGRDGAFGRAGAAPNVIAHDAVPIDESVHRPARSRAGPRRRGWRRPPARDALSTVKRSLPPQAAEQRSTDDDRNGGDTECHECAAGTSVRWLWLAEC